jgi:hypothetical protein
MTAQQGNWLIAGALAAGFLTWTFVSRRQPAQLPPKPAPGYQDFEGIDKLDSVAILRFYAAAGVLNEGEKATLCYGVAKARAVRLDPPVEELSPSLNRCFQVGPTADTRYTLTAEGEDGRTVSESFVLQVKPNPANIPRVVYFVSKPQSDGVSSLCFATENALLVSVDPPVIPPMEGAPLGCFYVAPKETTTYTMTVTGKSGRTATRRVTVKAPASR